MPVQRTYQCPSCEGVFRFLHHPSDEPPPAFCPLCGADVSGKKKTKRVKKTSVFADPNYRPGPILGVKGKSVNQVYRAMESASENRMNDAAELLGVHPSTLSNMKMTNMKDNVREGDLTMMPSSAPSEATKLTGSPAAIPGSPINGMTFQDKTAGAEYAKTVGQGPHPFAGNRMREMVTSRHQTTASAVVSQGRMNKK